MSKWIVVANAGRARIFEVTVSDGQMREIETLVHPESRQHQGDLVSDQAGHAFSAKTGSHSIDRQDVTKHQQADEFARRLCQTLEQGRNQGLFQRLYLIAAPQFLGLLRKHMSKPLQHLVSDEFAKDLTMADEAQIRSAIK